MKAKFVIEAANHPTDPDADEVYDAICMMKFIQLTKSESFCWLASDRVLT